MIGEKEARLYATMPEYKALVNKTMGFIRWALARVEKPYVACSFGKDSAAMLHLLLQESKGIDVRFVRWENETEHLGNYDEVISRWGDINLTQVSLSRATVEDRVKDRYSTDGYDSYFIGFRIEEAVARRITIKTHGVFYKMKEGKIRICPLADWKLRDVAAYCVSNNLPTLDTYEQFGFEERTSSRVPRADFGIRSQSLRLLKEKDVSKFNLMLSHFPELSNYV
jgi:sulfate adenylyltransferase subunit 2